MSLLKMLNDKTGKVMKRNLLMCLGVAAILMQGCKTHEAAFQGQALKETKDDAVINHESLTRLTNFIQDSSNTTGLMALQNGKIIYQYGDVEEISYIASCRKSVLSMLYGKHVDNGTIDLDQTIGELGIDEKDGLLVKEKQATVDDIITSRSGVFHVASNGGYDKENFLERGSVEPGEYFVYNNWDFNVAGHILEQATGLTVYQELEEQLAVPLGFEDWNIKNQKKYGKKRKSQYPAYHMYLSTRDMAKIGQLMLNEGTWEGQQLISREWVKKTTSTVTPFETMVERFGPADPDGVHMSYGYMWWLVENYRRNSAYEGAYTAIGYGGQFITIIPKMQLVIAHKTKLNLLTKIGITYKATEGDVYWEIVDGIVQALDPSLNGRR